jgi:hypothetical protein
MVWTAVVTRCAWIVALCLAGAPAVAAAQTAASPPVAAQDPDDDLPLVPAEPDFTLAALPTALRMPVGKFAFRMTHRFTRPIGAGDAGAFFSSLFGFDGGAKIGIEIRHGIRPGTDFSVHRTSDRTVQILVRHELASQRSGRAMTLDIFGGVEGRNNLGLSEELELPDSREWSGSLGAILARRVGNRGALYLEPIGVFHANVSPLTAGDDRHALLLGLGLRWRLGGGRTYLIAETAPRVAGFSRGPHHVSVAIEKRSGGHLFQLNVSNSLATTMGQLARGGSPNDDWYLGFNLTRRFW